MIELKGLQKSYGKVEVLKGIDLRLEKGAVHGIVGKNGAGKSTLFRCIAGLEKANAGTISIPFEPLKDHIGFLPTDPFILSKITAAEYLELHCLARKVDGGNLDEKNLFGLPLKRYVQHYSTGMKKKLALMALLMQNNEVYLLDEPYNGLDLESAMLLSGLIERLREKGKTVVLSSHIFSLLKDVCDSISYLEDGIIKSQADKGAFQSIETELKGGQDALDFEVFGL